MSKTAATTTAAADPAPGQPKPAGKPAAKPAAKRAAKASTVPAPQAKAPAKKAPPRASKAPKAAKAPKTDSPPTAKPAPADAAAAKPPKHKLVRDSFTIPRSEYQVLDALKQRLVQLAKPAKKSELLRAGIKLLAALPDEALIGALGAVPSIKTGRPGKSKA